MIIGGQAVLYYGEPRLTKDIDITLGLGPDKIPIILGICRILKLKVLVKDPKFFIRQTMVCPVRDEQTGIRVDFIFSYTPYERQAIARAVSVHWGRTRIKFAAIEDVIILKVIAGRARDIDDVRSMLEKNPRYDSRYIFRWLKNFDRSLKTRYGSRFQKICKEIK